MLTNFEDSWSQILEDEMAKPYFKKLRVFLENEKKAEAIVYPPESLIFNAFLQTSFDQVKVVIMGQDPYHGAGQAHGLSFSVPQGVSPPPSLKNIFKELVDDVKIKTPSHGCLSCWAKQGVLLLNATLTVRAGEPKSHHGKGWEQFTDAVIARLSKKEHPIVFVLWGKSAQEKYRHVMDDQKNPHIVLMAAHPSPYSARNGFFGCHHFSKINAYLEKWGEEPIDWEIV